MSRIYLKPFTFKRSISFVFLGLSCFIFNNKAHSENPPQITGHYYVAKDATNMKYNDLIEWEVTSYPEWSKFLDNLNTMPQDEEKNNPMGLRQPEIIYFSVKNQDQRSGHDIFISQAGIQQFSKMPLDAYYEQDISFQKFLDTERSINPGYDSMTENVDVNTPGIVVIFRGSSHLKNPYWVIKLSDISLLQRYKDFIQTLKPISTKWLTFFAPATDFDNDGSFILYLNYPNAPQQMLVVSPNGNIRGTKIEQKYSYYKDVYGYFLMFKRQAEDNLRAFAIQKNKPEENRKKAAASGALF